MSPKKANTVVIAALTQTSIGPSASSAAAATASTACGSAMSAGNATASAPAASASPRAASSPSRLRATSASATPGAAKRRTVARPMPLDAPVMTTTSDMDASRTRRRRSRSSMVRALTGHACGTPVPSMCVAMVSMPRAGRTPARADGYAPIRDYAVIGNKRTAALVALDGSIDWLAHPTFDAPSVLGALLDAGRGGRCTLAPTVAFQARRRYVPDTNVLETTFETADGAVRVTDGMSRPLAHGLLWNQVIRRVDTLSGRVPMAWEVAPRFDYGATGIEPVRFGGVPGFVHRDDVLAVETFDAGEPELADRAVRGEFTARDGPPAVLALSLFGDEPVTLSPRDHLLARLDATVERWRRWLAECGYDGPWRDPVRRSALALDLLVEDETGAIAAAVTMGLPERIGGDRNYDYRYAWLRDMNLTLEAMLRLGYRDQVHTSLAWMFGAVRRTLPRLRPMYRLDGTPALPARRLALDGYRGSRPVVAGNPAQDQLQLGNFGDVLDMTRAYVSGGGALGPRTAVELAEVADHLCRVWRRPDSGVWELPDRGQYTQGKLAAWLALTHAAELAELGGLPGHRAGAWRREAGAIERYLRTRCWSERQRSYVRAAGSDELDAAVLLAARGSFLEQDRPRLSATIDAVRRELGAGGPLVYRYSGMEDQEGAFLACSFWVAEALARAGRLEEAAEAIDALVGMANDVGLYAEEIDPTTGEFLGNLPQALVHLALVSAASVVSEAAG
jgi:GH15 family glucan-1,4-alpha-glucosidase